MKLIEKFMRVRSRRRRLYRVISVLACIVVFVTTYAMILPAITIDRQTALGMNGMSWSREAPKVSSGGKSNKASPAVNEADDVESPSGAPEETADTAPESNGAPNTDTGDNIVNTVTGGSGDDSSGAGGDNDGSSTDSKPEDTGSSDNEGGTSGSGDDNTSDIGSGDGNTSSDSNSKSDVDTSDQDHAADAGSTSTASSDEISGQDSTAANTTTTENDTAAETEDTSDGSTADSASTAQAALAEEVRMITEATELTAKGSGYKVYVIVNKESLLPVGTVLKVREITRENNADEYRRYYEKAQEKLRNQYDGNTSLSFARFYDISFTYKDEPIEPAGNVTVRIDYSRAVEMEANASLDTIHFDGSKAERPELIRSEMKLEDGQKVRTGSGGAGDLNIARESAENGSAVRVSEVEFEADSFSVYGIVGTTIEEIVLAGDGNKYRITATYGSEAGIPADARLEIEEITEESDEYAAYVALTESALGFEEGGASYIRMFDIGIVDKDDAGIKYQPANGAAVDVRIELADADSAGLSVVHFADGSSRGDIVESTTESSGNGSVVRFAAEGFSVYAVADEGPVRTYSFYSPDASGTYDKYYFTTDSGESVYQQKIKTVDGVTEELIIPQLPSIAGSDTSTFAGWYVYDEAAGTYADEPFDFENIPAVTAEEEVILRARFANYAYVIFHEQYNGSSRTWPIAETRRGQMENGAASIQIDDVTVTYDDSETEEDTAPQMAFRGWSRTKVDAGEEHDQNGDPVVIESSPIQITGNVDLYPVFVPINWLTFSSGPTGSGATYVPPRYYYTDEGETDFPIPVRTGYEFDGWYTAETGGTKIVNGDGTIAISGTVGAFTVVDGELRLTDDTMLYGHWTEASTKYTVVIWRQKSTDEPNLADTAKQYDYAESFTLDTTTGSTVSVANSYKQLAGSGDYTGFHYGRCDDAKQAAGNGSTVLNVYYDRNVHTLTFRVRNSTVRTITGLYGSSVKDYFPITGTNGTSYDGYVWDDQSNPAVYSYVLSTLETMPDANVTFSGESRGTNKTIYYYVEVEDASESDGTVFNGNYYKLYKTVKHNYRYITYNEEYHPITGYIRDYSHANPVFVYSAARGGYAADIGSGNANYLYYDRDTYNITFTDSYTNQNVIVNGSEITPVSVKYDQKIENYVPDDPTSTREGYRFTGWYADSACSTRVYFNEEDYNSAPEGSKVLYERMPAYNMQLFAGWETEWYLIEIDPNGGVLTGTQSTWFWEPYNGDPIEEYTTTTRNYIESLNGTYYYALQDRDYYGLTDEWNSAEDGYTERVAYYTEELSDPAADLSKKYEPAQDAYRYVAWYEVHEDGSETLYAFGQPVMHNTKLRLHWKQIGTYYIRYDAGEGTLDDQDNNEETFNTLDDSDYTDHANVVVTRTANAPEGKSFVGWTIRGGDGTVYYPGQAFEFQSLYAFEETVDGVVKDYLILDAVYSTIGSAKIIYDANGGTVDSASVDYGAPAEADAYSETQCDETTATISGLLNNSEVVLSDGSGFSLEGAVFSGWNTEPDGSGEHFDAGGNYYVDREDPATLYAEWKVKVYFDQNNDNADWGGSWDTETYTWDEGRQQYYTYAYVNGTVDEPVYVPASSEPGERFAYWSPVRYTDSGEVAYEYDFSTPIAGELTLYGFWANAIQLPYHVVDASTETLTEENGWKIAGQETFQVNTGTDIPLSAQSDTEDYVNIPDGYEYAFACVSDSLENCSEDNIITNIGYNTTSKRVSVTYADGSTEDLPSDKEIYLVYFRNPKNLNISYKLMETDGSLSNATVSSQAPATASVGNYDMTGNVTSPLSWAGNAYQYFSYAIGDAAASSSAGLHLITESSSSDGSRPALQIRNTWRGYQYSSDGGATWVNYGYDPELYVIYFQSEPTLVTINEETIGTQADLSEEFEYQVVITETVTTYSRTDRFSRSGSWGNYQYTLVETGTPSQTGSPSSSEIQTSTYSLSDGEAETNTLFYTKSPDTADGDYYSGGGWWNIPYYRDFTYTVTTQTITVTQTPKNGFTTTNDSTGDSHVSEYIYTYTTSADSTDQEVTYTNTRTQTDVELHIAIAENGSFTAHDADMRTTDAGIYTVTIPNGETVNLSSDNPEGLFTGDTETYRFAGIIYGQADEEGRITAHYTDVSSVSFAPIEGSEYLGVYMNGDPSRLMEEGYDIYYVYYRMPKIVYMMEGANGALTEIDPIERNGAAVTLNGGAVTQNMQLEVGSSAFVIDQAANGGYRVPPDLDGDRALSLNYVKIGAGAAGKTNTADLDMTSETQSLQLKVVDSQVKYSLDGNEWEPFSGDPTVYIIYKEKGYDLTIRKEVDGSDTEQDFDLVISSEAITETAYSISGYEVDGETVESIAATPAAGDTPGTISLKIRKGSNITISALQRGAYTLSEPELEDYGMYSAAVGGYAQTVADDSFSFVLTSNNTAVITNRPSAVPVRLKKIGVDNRTGTVLEENLGGAVFTIYTDSAHTTKAKGIINGTERTLQNLTSSETDGVFFDGELNIGTYYVFETRAPDGYNPIGNDLLLIVEADGVSTFIGGVTTPLTADAEGVYTAEVTNYCGYALPESGGSGTGIFTAIGLMLIAAAGGLLALRQRHLR